MPSRMKILQALSALTICAICAFSCSTEKPTAPNIPHNSIAVYVRAGATGNGTREEPIGSIQSAIDMVGSDTPRTRIYVAIGDYSESILITNGLHILGGRDPEKNWDISSSGITRIIGQRLFDEAVAVVISDVRDSVTLSGLRIEGLAANQSGRSSYGLYCFNSDRVIITDCDIVSGEGSDGRIGASGSIGRDGEIWDVAHGGFGGLGSYEVGGYYDSTIMPGRFVWIGGAIIPAESGSQGYCANGSISGGLSGEIGAQGDSGTDGQGASANFFLDSNSLFLETFFGTDGAIATGGCGGGGGEGGSISPLSGFSASRSGGCGGTGGNGGEKGGSGEGGGSGGSSVAVAVINSSISIQSSTISCLAGANGGRGGDGGIGGLGSPGADGCCSFNVCIADSVIYCGDICNGLPGGDGGDGGHGGHGGGGAGGSCIGILSSKSVVDLATSVTFQLGQPGAGGASEGDSGEDGIAKEVHVID